MNFVHLHAHSEYSILDGMARIDDIVKRLKYIGAEAHAITDHGTLGGIPHFYWAMKKAGLTPILGIELYVDVKLDTRFPGHLTVLVKNERGYRQLIEINNLAQMQFYDRPRVTYQQLLEMPVDGLIALSGCPSSVGSTYTLAGHLDVSEQLYRGLRGKMGGFYLEIQRHEDITDLEFDLRQRVLANSNLELWETTSIQPVFTNDCHYVDEDNERIHQEIIRAGKEAGGKSWRGLEFSGRGFWIKSAEEIARVIPEPVRRTLMQSSVNIAKEIGAITIPEFETTHWHVPFMADEPIKEVRRIVARKGRLLGANEVYKKRFEHELAVIQQANLANNYLASLDYVEWAKENDITVGPGRGSMTGSLVSYALGITEVDPVKRDLLFERAINPARPSIPDFDIDFSSKKRHLVFEYLLEKYGVNSLHIGTMGRYSLKGSLRQVLRVLEVPFMEINKLMKDLDQEGITFEDLDDLFGSRLISDYVAMYPELPAMVNTMFNIPFNNGTHAAGIVISDDQRPLLAEVPLGRSGQGGERISAFDMEVLKKMGFVKFDILGLSALDIIDEATKAAGVTIEWEKLDYEDPNVYAIINQEYYKALFQIEGMANIQVCKAMGGLQTFEDIVAMNALGRPGAIQFLSRFCAWRKHPEDIEWPETRFLPALLDKTYGVILYQEQVMEIARMCAGFDDILIDDIKEAIKFFRDEVFARLEPDFKAGCIKNGITLEATDKIWDMIKDFAGYGFNRNHSVAYAMIAYATAWLKTYYPTEFYCAALNNATQDEYNILIGEGRRRGLKFEAPDVTRSDAGFSIRDGRILFGIDSVKYCSKATAKEIIGKRPFKDINDFETRVTPQKCNSRSRKYLEAVSAFRNLEGSAALTDREIRKFQKEILGVILEYSPHELMALEDNHPMEGTRVGILAAEKRIITKNGDPMGFLKFEDGDIDVTLFSREWLAYKAFKIAPGNVVRIDGVMQEYNGRKSFVGRAIRAWQ